MSKRSGAKTSTLRYRGAKASTFWYRGLRASTDLRLKHEVKASLRWNCGARASTLERGAEILLFTQVRGCAEYGRRLPWV